MEPTSKQVMGEPQGVSSDTYTITLSRKDAALYLAWEYGIHQAHAILTTLPTAGRVALPATFVPLTTLRLARRWAARISEVVAWQHGRLGRSAMAATVEITKGDEAWSCGEKDFRGEPGKPQEVYRREAVRAIPHAIVMTSSAKMPGSVRHPYRNVAVVLVEGDNRPAMISAKARGVVRIVHHFGPQCVGKTAKCAYQRTLVKAQRMADELNTGDGLRRDSESPDR